MTIASIGKLTPDEARSEARKLASSVVRGFDPAGEKLARSAEMTVAELIAWYEREGCYVQRGTRIGQPMKPLTKQYTLARLNHHVIPLIGKKRLSDVTGEVIERLARDIAAGKTAKDETLGPRRRIIVKGGDGAARKVVRDLSAVFSFARKVVPINPVDAAAVRKVDNKRDRYLTLDEVKRLGEAFRALESSGTNPKAIAIARLWALTGCRRDEIARLRWSEVDLERGLLLFDDSKTGKSCRPLSQVAAAQIASIERSSDSPFVFPAESGRGYYAGTKRIWPKVVAKAALAGVTPHTLRHTLGSTSVSAGEAIALVGAILGHVNHRSTQIYAHVQVTPAQRAADRAAGRIADALDGKAPRVHRKRPAR